MVHAMGLSHLFYMNVDALVVKYINVIRPALYKTNNKKFNLKGYIGKFSANPMYGAETSLLNSTSALLLDPVLLWLFYKQFC